MRRYTLSAAAFCYGELPLASFYWMTSLMPGSASRGIDIKQAGSVLVDRMSHLSVQTSLQNIPC
jgi:hypothetical protein